MKFVQFTRPARLLGAACLLAAGSGQALAGVSGPVLSDCTTLAGTNGLVTVTECAFSGGSGPVAHGGAYGVVVKDTVISGITNLMVSTNNPIPSDGVADFLPFTSRGGWSAAYLPASDWNLVYAEFLGKPFSDLFGADSAAYIFFANAAGDLLPPGAEVSASSLTFGWYGGSPNSQFVALNGLTIVSQSFTSPVPEPSAYALMLAGLGALGLLVRRRRTA